MHADEYPASREPRTLEREFEIALRQGLLGRERTFRVPVAAVPELHGAAAVFSGRYRAFEIAIVERMVLDLDGQPLIGWIERRAAGHRPGLEHSLPFQAQIVVQAPSVVLLHDEAQPRGGSHAPIARRFGGLCEIPLASVCLERGLGHAHAPCRATMRR